MTFEFCPVCRQLRSMRMSLSESEGLVIAGCKSAQNT